MGEILILDQSTVEELLDPAGCVAAVERALVAVARGEIHLPLRTIVRPPGEETLIGLMPTHRGGEDRVYGLKTVVVVHDNPTRGLDPHQGTVTLYDGETGQVRAIVNATPITAIRTAAASAVATRALARENARVLAIVGTGHQGKAHAHVLPAVIPFERVILAGRDTAEEAVREADVVVTATNSPEPVLRREWLKEGVHINAVGACFPHTRELDSATVADATLIADSRESVVNESGDYLVPLAEGAIGDDHIAAELGDVLTGAHPGRTSDGEITVFDSLGIAAEDLFAAEYVVSRARAEGRGQSVAFS